MCLILMGEVEASPNAKRRTTSLLQPVGTEHTPSLRSATTTTTASQASSLSWWGGGVGSLLPSSLSACPTETLLVISELLHPLEMGRLSLCSQTLLKEMEDNAAMLCSRLLSLSSTSSSSSSSLSSSSSGSSSPLLSKDSWRYRYLCAMEVALVDSDKLKIALTQLYNQQQLHNQLNLYGLHMGDDGAEHLALALRVAKTHKVGLINLSGNDITDKGAQAIVHALQGHHDEVNTLFLAQNQIGATGARCLAKFISQSHNLRSLSLSENPINDEGASIISGALPGSTTLSTLS